MPSVTTLNLEDSHYKLDTCYYKLDTCSSHGSDNFTPLNPGTGLPFPPTSAVLKATSTIVSLRSLPLLCKGSIIGYYHLSHFLRRCYSSTSFHISYKMWPQAWNLYCRIMSLWYIYRNVLKIMQVEESSTRVCSRYIGFFHLLLFTMQYKVFF